MAQPGRALGLRITSVPQRCPRTAITAIDPHQQQPANMKLVQALNPQATHTNTLVMRRSLVSDEDLGAEAPTALRGTLLKAQKRTIEDTQSGAFSGRGLR
jgi:hypothetical protein